MANKIVSNVWRRIDPSLKNRLVKGALNTAGQAAKDLYRLAGNRRVRLAVTGLSRSGKSVFITSLVNQLLESAPGRHRLPQLRVMQDGRYLGAEEVQQADSTVPTFRYDDHYATLLGNPPDWPESTTDISQLRLHIRSKPSGFLDGMLSDYQDFYLDIIDYPGEWLVDLGMLEQSFDDWSALMLQQAGQPHLAGHSGPWRDFLDSVNDQLDQRVERQTIERGHALFRAYLLAAKADGFNYLQPGRIILPGLLAGSPAVTFFPCPRPAGATPAGNSLYGQLAARFEMYKKDVIRPFYEQHFVKFDCQVVLVDLMYALEQGPAHFNDSQRALNALLASFNHGRSSLISRLFSPKIDRILFAATKVDQVNRAQYQSLQKLLEATLRPTIKKADFAGIRYLTLALASVKATETVIESGSGQQPEREYVRGRLLSDSFDQPPKELYYAPGALPDNLPSEQSWRDHPFQFYAFHPPPLKAGQGRSFPHINMDKAIEFLLGDRL